MADDLLGQIGTGPIVSDLLSDANADVVSYQWVHGDPLHAFEPHADLDGVQFTEWDDEQLQNTYGWPEVEYFAPGDHDGCTCDFTVLFTEGTDAPDEEDS